MESNHRILTLRMSPCITRVQRRLNWTTRYPLRTVWAALLPVRNSCNYRPSIHRTKSLVRPVLLLDRTVGVEPTTYRFRGVCSTTELSAVI